MSGDRWTRANARSARRAWSLMPVKSAVRRNDIRELSPFVFMVGEIFTTRFSRVTNTTIESNNAYSLYNKESINLC